MKSPIRIIVVADFKGTSDVSGCVRAQPGNTDALIEALKPAFVLKSGVTFQLNSMSDFLPSGIQLKLKNEVSCSDDITTILHDRAFQEVEESWRGLDFLVSRLPKDGVVLEILDASFEDLRRRVFDLVMQPDYKGESEFPSTIILGDYDFEYKGHSFDCFVDLAKMAEAIRAPFVGQTGASFFNLKHLLHLPTIKNPLSQISQSGYSEYHQFRESDTSFWASLMINRALLRAPYSGEEYTEPAIPSKPEQYLFGRGIWILGANLIKSYASKEHMVAISGMGSGGEQLGLPVRELPLSRTEKVRTPLEASLPIDIVEGLPYLGLSPLSQLPSEMGGQNQPGMIYLHLAANMHQVPDPEGKQFGLLTVETSLSYSLMLGRISNLALKHLQSMSSTADTDALASDVKNMLLEEMWTKEEDEIQVEVNDGKLKVSYKPFLVIHTRQFEIELEIPL